MTPACPVPGLLLPRLDILDHFAGVAVTLSNQVVPEPGFERADVLPRALAAQFAHEVRTAGE